MTLDERRRKAGVRDVKPSRVNNADATLHTSIHGFFVYFLPVVGFIKSRILIPVTNASFSEPLKWEELFCFLGLIFVMAAMQGVARSDFWVNNVPDFYCGAPFCLHSYMSRNTAVS